MLIREVTIDALVPARVTVRIGADTESAFVPVEGETEDGRTVPLGNEACLLCGEFARDLQARLQAHDGDEAAVLKSYADETDADLREVLVRFAVRTVNG